MKPLIALLLLIFTQSLYAQSSVHINFDGDEVGLFPSNWVSRDPLNMTRIYSVQTEGGKKFLHADAKGLSVQISHRITWNLKTYPILRWRWRPVVFPTGSNERIRSGGDSALGIYVVLRGWPFVRTIKYIWSDTLPVGAEFNSPYSSGTKMIVIRNGRERGNTWVTEERNVLLDCERLFGKEEEGPTAQGIALLTDSDDTNSHAVGDYAEFGLYPSK